MKHSSFPTQDGHGVHTTVDGRLIAEIEGLDETTQWPLIVTRAFEGGLDREEACLELSCSWSTVTRWMTGRTAPGPLMRKAVKGKLIEMLERQGHEKPGLGGAGDVTSETRAS